MEQRNTQKSRKSTEKEIAVQILTFRAAKDLTGSMSREFVDAVVDSEKECDTGKYR